MKFLGKNKIKEERVDLFVFVDWRNIIGQILLTMQNQLIVF